jgi:hypothetical protein
VNLRASRRALAVFATLIVALGSVIPAAHIHFSATVGGGLEAKIAHQHLSPHILSATGHEFHHVHIPGVATLDDDDSALTEYLSQFLLTPRPVAVVPVLLEAAFVDGNPLVSAPPFFRAPDETFFLPPGPSLSPRGLRAPPLV